MPSKPAYLQPDIDIELCCRPYSVKGLEDLKKRMARLREDPRVDEDEKALELRRMLSELYVKSGPAKAKETAEHVRRLFECGGLQSACTIQ